MDFYYDTESFISAKPDKATALRVLARRLRVGTVELEIVLDEFFEFDGEVWKNQYCDQVIADYHSYQERQRANGSKGGRGNKANANPNKPTALPNKAKPKLTINNKQETINHSSEAFYEFWKAYPKKKNKGDAEKAWVRIDPDSSLLIKIFKSITLLKQSDDWIKESGQYIPYPASWLNAQGWEDEINTDASTTNHLRGFVNAW